MRRPFVHLLKTLSVLGLLLGSCSKEKEDPKQTDFDRKALLTHLGTKLILPNYNDFKTTSGELYSALTQFEANPDLNTLSDTQTKLKQAYKSYQAVSVFEFGPAEQELFRSNLNTFPTDVAQINTNIAAGTYDLATAGNLDAKGFPGLDYLLFGTGSDPSAILAAFTTDALAANRRKYATDLSLEIMTLANTVWTAWTATGGNYLNTFVEKTGTDAESSLAKLVNQLNLDYEIVKNPKIGVPLGKKSLGDPRPNNVEALYSGISMELARANFQNLANVYFGKDQQGNNGLGLDDYLIALGARRGNEYLAEAIHAQFNTISTRLAAIPDPLSEAIQNNPGPVNQAYDEIQAGVVLLKTDMPSALGVIISYQDNDGD